MEKQGMLMDIEKTLLDEAAIGKRVRELAEQIGPEAAEKLCDALGGFEWMFPNKNSMDEV